MRAIAIMEASTWTGEPADRVVLDYDNRRRRRMAMRGMKGVVFLLDLPASPSLRGGEAFVLEDGRLIEVVAAPEPLLEMRCADPAHFARLAWHLGNRHLPVQVIENAVRVRRDHVIAEMAVGLGAEVSEIEAAFNPEGGASSGSRSRYHSHEDA
jgi:urease accessory protein